MLLTLLHSLNLHQVRIFKRRQNRHKLIWVMESFRWVAVRVFINFLKLLINLQLLLQTLWRLLNPLCAQWLNNEPFLLLSLPLLDLEPQLFPLFLLLNDILLFLIGYAKIQSIQKVLVLFVILKILNIFGHVGLQNLNFFSYFFVMEQTIGPSIFTN